MKAQRAAVVGAAVAHARAPRRAPEGSRGRPRTPSCAAPEAPGPSSPAFTVRVVEHLEALDGLVAREPGRSPSRRTPRAARGGTVPRRGALGAEARGHLRLQPRPPRGTSSRRRRPRRWRRAGRRRSGSRCWRGTFFPPAVTRMSFLRSMIWRKPSSVHRPTSPVLNHPSSVKASRVAARPLWYPRKTLGPRRESRRRPRGEAPPTASACPPCRSGKASGRLERQRRRRLRQPVALDDQHPMLVEELLDLRLSPRARQAEAQPSARDARELLRWPLGSAPPSPASRASPSRPGRS